MCSPCREISVSVSTRAYEICSGQISAAPETHATLIASLVVQTTATGSASSTSSQPTPSSSTTAQETANTRFSASSISPTASSAASSTAASQTTRPATSSLSESLSTPAIIGISVGATAAFVFLAGLYLLARRTRRRRLEGTGPLLDDWKPEARDAPGFRRRPESHQHELEISLPINLDPQGLGLVNTDGRRFENARRPPEYTQGALPGNASNPTAMVVPLQTNQPVRTPSPNETSSSWPQPGPQLGPQPWRGAAPSQPQATAAGSEIIDARSQYQKSLALPQRTIPPAQERESIITEFAEDGDPDSAADRLSMRRSELLWPHQSSPNTRSLVSGMLDGYGSGWTSEDQLSSRRGEVANGRRAAPVYATTDARNPNYQNPFVSDGRQRLLQAREQYQSRPVMQPQKSLERNWGNTYNSQTAPMQYSQINGSRPRTGTRLESASQQTKINRQLFGETTAAELSPVNLNESSLIDMAQWPSPVPVPPLKVKRAGQRQPQQSPLVNVDSKPSLAEKRLGLDRAGQLRFAGFKERRPFAEIRSGTD